MAIYLPNVGLYELKQDFSNLKKLKNFPKPNRLFNKSFNLDIKSSFA